MTTSLHSNPPRPWNVLIGCTGSITAMKLPLLLDSLHNMKIGGHAVLLRVMFTKNSRNFVCVDEITESFQTFTDEDEWYQWKTSTEPVLHLELVQWADILVIAPLDANTLAKLANGLCDNLLTCVVRAWDRSKPLLLAPAMSVHMWDNPLTAMHLSMLHELGYLEVPCTVRRKPPAPNGYIAAAEVETIVEHVTNALLDVLSESTKMRNMRREMRSLQGNKNAEPAESENKTKP